MAKLLGKLIGLLFDSNEVDIKNYNWSEDGTVLDGVDSATAGDGTETLIGRFTRSLQVDSFLKDGTGEKLLGLNTKFNFNGVDYGVTDLTYDVAYDDVDVTDTDTSGDGTESAEDTYAERKCTINLWKKDTQAELPPNDPKAATLTLATGKTISGTFKIENLSDQGEVRGAQKYTVTGTFQGAVSEVGMPLPMGVQKATEMIFKDGGITDKKYTGNSIILQRSISADRNADIKVSHTFKFNGGIAKSEYTA